MRGIYRGAHVLFLRHEDFGEWFLIGWVEDVGHCGERDFDGLAVNVGSGEHGVPSSSSADRESNAADRLRAPPARLSRSCTIHFVRILLLRFGNVKQRDRSRRADTF